MKGLPISEKEPLTDSSLPVPTSTRPARPSTGARFAKALKLALLAYVAYLATSHAYHVAAGASLEQASAKGDICPQFPARSPPADATLDGHKEHIFSPEYRLESVALHSGMVKIPTESYDDNGPTIGPDADTRWDIFAELHSYLATAFPEVHATLSLDKVNTWGLVYTWQGSDPSLKPTMMMAHQDVVPVNPSTVDEWTYAPYSGHYDGEFIWGRGAGDCKSMLSGELEAITLLIKGGFKPRRTVILAFGFDEESKGLQGAGHIAEFLEDRYGKDSMAIILDEGGLGIQEMFGNTFAMPATSEKGYLDWNATLHTQGGHSSIPPAHTGIGILGEIAYRLEENPYPIGMSETSPIFGLLQCAAEHGELPKALKGGVLAGSGKSKAAQKARDQVAKAFAKISAPMHYLVATSQAVDIVGGGVKVNALPELSYLVTNQRISVDSSVEAVTSNVEAIISPIAKKHNLDVDFFGNIKSFRSSADAVSGGKLKLKALNPLEPAPITPTGTAAWEVLSSAVQQTFATPEKAIIVSPAIMTGNTDTRFMWALSEHIYRFSPQMHRDGNPAGAGIHTVDEHASVSSHIEGVYFFHEFVRLADVADM